MTEQQSRRVLVVEDEYLIAMNIQDILEDMGFSVQTAVRADAAWLLLDKGGMAFDLVFTDIDTPGAFDGLELARRVAEGMPEARILIASGRRIPTARDLPEGACFLSKPYMFQQLELALTTFGLAD